MTSSDRKRNALIWPFVGIVVFAAVAACQPSANETAGATKGAGPTERAGKRIDQAVERSADVARQSTEVAKSAGQNAATYVDDSILTTKIKTVLFRDPQTSGFQITVNTYQGVVQLSGFVDTMDQKDRAGELVQEIEGVQALHNDLIVKTRTTHYVPTKRQMRVVF